MEVLELIYKNKISILQQTFDNFTKQHSFLPCFGVELEFYLLNNNLSAIDQDNLIEYYLTELEQILAQFFLFKKVEKEQGRGQIELKTLKTFNLLELAKEITEIKSNAISLAKKHNLIASFAAQPFLDDCGSALQLNISLYNLDQTNLFIRTYNQENELLLYSIAGLLSLANEMMPLYAPNSKDYLRFRPEINFTLHKKGKYTAPINLSWGEDNRTTAIRIPPVKDKNLQNEECRLEFRVPCANSDIYLAISCCLISLTKGIKDKLHLEYISRKGIYGNAFEDQYKLPNLLYSYEAGINNFNKENFMTNFKNSE